MKRPETLVKRSFAMVIASYYLSRCGVQKTDGPTDPPSALGVSTWKEAYDFFYDGMGDGRTPSQFRNSMKNVRDTFDTVFANGRIGWIDQDGKQSSLSGSAERVHEEWIDHPDNELEEFVFSLHSGIPVAKSDADTSTEARTEGGKRVFISIRRERDPKLRQLAIALHGLDCMACGFNFEKVYGPLGDGFIEVHHVTPLSEVGLSSTDAETDLVVLCANCHRMLHRKKGICLSLGELKRKILT